MAFVCCCYAFVYVSMVRYHSLAYVDSQKVFANDSDDVVVVGGQSRLV